MEPIPLDGELLMLLARAKYRNAANPVVPARVAQHVSLRLRPLDPGNARFVGEAFTLRYIPAREDIDVVEAFQDPEHPQRKAVESVGAGQVLVMDCRNERVPPQPAASW